jgi:hypothetical protein
MESRWSSSRRPLDTGGRRAARETSGTHRHDALPIRLAGMAGGAGEVTVSRRRSSRFTPRDTCMSRLFPLPALSRCRPERRLSPRPDGDRRALLDWHSSPQHDGQPPPSVQDYARPSATENDRICRGAVVLGAQPCRLGGGPVRCRRSLRELRRLRHWSAMEPGCACPVRPVPRQEWFGGVVAGWVRR